MPPFYSPSSSLPLYYKNVYKLDLAHASCISHAGISASGKLTSRFLHSNPFVFHTRFLLAAEQHLLRPYPSKMEESKFYYAGLPSSPILVDRTSTPWTPPTGLEAYRQPKELRPVGNHELIKVWEDRDGLGKKALRLLEPDANTE